MTYFRKFTCLCLGHTYVIRRFRHNHKILGWQECLVCGYQPIAIAWRDALNSIRLPSPLCCSEEDPRIRGLVEMEKVDAVRASNKVA